MGQVVRKVRISGWYIEFAQGRLKVYEMQDELIKWLNENPGIQVVQIFESKDHAGVSWDVIYREEE